MRLRATWSIALPGTSARPGAAMWMPTMTVPLPRPRTESESSISVVCESSMEKACTPSASGNASVIAGA